MTGRKVQVALDGRMQSIIKLLQRSRGDTIAGVVREALLFYDWCRRAHEDGFTIVAIKGNVQREPALLFTTPSGETR